MVLTPQDIMKDYIDDGTSLERITTRKHPLTPTLTEPNPEWGPRFLATKTRLTTALGPTLLTIQHIGSTSIPNLPAKDIIDIDLVVNDITDETSYVPALENAGFTFLLREPAWHQHRFFVDEGDTPGGYAVNLHVFGAECPEVEKHRIFREWLVKTPGDVGLYARVKRECAAAAGERGETVREYTARKEGVIREILGRAFRDLGYVE